MPQASDPPRSGRFKAVPDATHPPAWQLTDAPDRSPFFFAWDGGPAEPGPGRAVADAGCRIARRIRAGTPAAAAWIRRAGMSLTDGDDEDDTTLSVCGTRLYDRTKRQSDPERYVDTATVPFLTLSARVTHRATGVALGDHSTVIEPRSGRVVHAIVGDDRLVAGAEPSLFLTEALGLAPFDPAIYLVYPGTGLGQGVIPDLATIHRHGEALFRRRPEGWRSPWMAILRDCFEGMLADGAASP